MNYTFIHYNIIVDEYTYLFMLTCSGYNKSTLV